VFQEDKVTANVPGQGQDKMAHKGSLVSDTAEHQNKQGKS
jgi:hypothetical protein